MAELNIRVKKSNDGSAALACGRSDGSTAWQRLRGAARHFFALRDLTHLAVETTLGSRRGFFGLPAEGWQVNGFCKAWPRGPLPPEAARVGLIVVLLGTDRAGRVPALLANEPVI